MKKFSFLFLLVILVSCSPQRRLARLLERYPLPVDTTVTVKDTTIYRDTLVYIHLPGDTVYTDTIIRLKAGIPFEIDLPYMELKTRSTMAEAHAWILNNRLGLKLIQFDSVYQFKLDSILRTTIDSVFIEVVREIPVEIDPKSFWKHGFLVLAGLILISLILLLVLKRK